MNTQRLLRRLVMRGLLVSLAGAVGCQLISQTNGPKPIADADGDGVADAADVCPGSDDTIDADSDGVPDGCDDCPGGDDNQDSDNDGVADACDRCAEGDDGLDVDGDGVPDACDACPGFDDRRDADGDGTPDGCDFESTVMRAELVDFATFADGEAAVDFSDLRVGDEIVLTIPADRPLTRQTVTCTCVWSVQPDEAGSFDPPGECTTVFTVEQVGEAVIGVVQTCNGSSQEFFNGIIVQEGDDDDGPIIQEIAVPTAVIRVVSPLPDADCTTDACAPETQKIVLDARESVGTGYLWSAPGATIDGPSDPEVALPGLPASQQPVVQIGHTVIACPSNAADVVAVDLTITLDAAGDPISAEDQPTDSAELTYLNVLTECPSPPPVTPAPTGACCVAGVCSVQAASSCAAAGGVYQGDGVPCNAGTCQVVGGGACCLATGCETRTETECLTLGGVFNAGVSCTPDPCPTGACCFPDSSCQDDLTPGECLGQGGFPRGDGVQCADLPAGACLCGNGTVDAGEECDPPGACCIDCQLSDAGTVCRPSLGTCDVGETCDGVSTSCPPDAFQPNTFVCRIAAGPCDIAETCPGNGPACPANAFQPNTLVCRNAAGPCDVAENCPGNGPLCPGNALVPANTECRPSTDDCDPAEVCDGVDPACPGDVVITACVNGDDCCPVGCDFNNDTDCGAPVTGNIFRGDHVPPTVGTLAAGRPITVELVDVNGDPFVPRLTDTTTDGTYTVRIPPFIPGGFPFDGRIRALAEDEFGNPTDIRFEVPEFVLSNVTEAGVTLDDDTMAFIAFYDYYVDDNGNVQPGFDPGAPLGTLNNPHSTIQAPVDLVLPGDHVLVKAGTYFETVQARRNGRPERRILIQNHEGAAVTIDSQLTRENCLFIGKAQAPGGGDYVTVDGFTCINPAALTGSAAGVLVFGTHGATVRNCDISYQPFNGTNDQSAKGIFVQGPNQDTLIEFNHVHHIFIGIQSRFAAGDFSGFPERPIFRWNHVHHCNMIDPAAQNNAAGITASNSTTFALIEHNVVHHCDDGGIVTDDSGGHIVRYNIAYLVDHLDTPGGNGPGIKIKPVFSVTPPDHDVVHHNVTFLNRSSGFEINAWPDTGLGHEVYHNTAFGNAICGISITGPNPARPEQHSIVMNNLGFGNGNCDVGYSGNQSEFDYNVNPTPVINTHSVLGDPGLAGLNLLDGIVLQTGVVAPTPAVLAPLDDPASIPGLFPDIASQILYAKSTVAAIFGLLITSPAVDAGVDLGLTIPCADDFDCFGSSCNTGTGFCNAVTDAGSPAHVACDDPLLDPWDDDADAGVVDIGAFEFQHPVNCP